MLHAGIIGLGVGEAHIKGYNAHPGCEVTAVCDFSEEKLGAARDKYPGLKICSSADDILDDPAIQVVSIASFDNFHCEQIIKALANGKHVFVEKPLCLFKEEAQKIRAALQKRPDLHLSSNLILRRAPRFVNLRKDIQAGRYGELYHVEGDYTYGRLHKLTAGWRGEIDYYSVVCGGAIHLIDLLLWLTGDSVVEVASFANNISTKGTQFLHNDMVVSILKFKSGMVGKITANFGSVFPHFHPLLIYGTKGTFVNGRKEAQLYESADPAIAPRAITDDYPGAQKGDLLHDFIEGILSKKSSVVGINEIFNTISVCFAIEEAVKSNKVTAVDYV